MGLLDENRIAVPSVYIVSDWKIEKTKIVKNIGRKRRVGLYRRCLL